MATPIPLRSVSTTPIAIVGNLNLDIRTAPIRGSAHVLEDGETSVDEIYESIGGGGANVALAAARLGGRVHFAGGIGKDELGAKLRRHLERFGVVTHLALKDSPTGRSIALTWDHHHRHFISCLPSSALLDGPDIHLDDLIARGCRHLYRADVWFAPRLLDGGNEALLRRARAADMETILDLNWDPYWDGGDAAAIARRLESVRSMLKYVSVVHGNERELGRFAATDDTNAAVNSILRDGANAVIVHRGGHGSAAFTRSGESAQASAYPVSQAVNQTGTGDVFAAALMLLPHLPLSERLTASNAIAASHLEGSAELLPRL